MNVTDEVAHLMASDREDYLAIMAEGEMEGDSEATWVVYLPSYGRAVILSNIGPIWYDATSLEDAVRSSYAGGTSRRERLGR